MRPLKLTMQAFGSFPSKVEIPFENLGKGNIYLISGVTGSGKTTIFDAISYALFNSSSGENRGNSTFKSHFAKDDTESFVTLEFLFNGEKYIITRYPSYEQKKTRGEGTVLKQSRALLTLPDGKIIEKVKEIDNFIVELLGMNSAQFGQIALLAQGEFLKLLHADTQTRADVFRRIFKTWNYADFQQKLKEKSNSYKNDYEALKNSILQYISEIQPLDNQLLELKENYLQSKYFDNLSDFVELLDLQNKDDEKKLKQIKNEVVNFEKEINEKKDYFSKIQNKLSIIKQIQDYNNELKNKNIEYEKIKKEYLNLEKYKKQHNNLILEIEKTQQSYKKALEIKELKAQILSDKKQLETGFSALEQIKNKIHILKIEHLKYSFNSYLNFKNTATIKKESFIKLQKETQKQANEYLKNYNDYLKIQAGIIAQSLCDDSPCPVCGSLSHPNPAKIENKNLTKEFLDSSKEELDLLNSNLSKIAQECSVLNEKTDFSKELYNSLLKKYELAIKEEKTDFLELDFETEINSELKELEIQNEKNNSKILSIKSIEAKIETLLKDIKTDDIESILNLQNKQIDEKDLLEKQINEIEQTYSEIKNDITNLSSKIDLLNSQLIQFSSIDETKLEQINLEVDKLIKILEELENSIHKIIIRKSINEKTLETIKRKNLEFQKLCEIYSHYKILSDCANGNMSKNVKIPFEQYIQGYYLDLVLHEANKRLKIMTQNQFQLIRKKDIDSRQSKTGLDLEVMDFHTFKKRSTKTLSGGESFKAALSLALGLSDCISNFSSAMNIEAMFIDEGFGSLDSESLELAMDVIFNLSDNNRLIGIISHIEDLKSKIENQITTIKTENGSKLVLNF
ncbi:MAG: SMC family ATPase [Candidatus Gastranaerophilales bacterium]|nr:SMC family ATPase [Candidatus Gastranaerophilales bacterium]